MGSSPMQTSLSNLQAPAGSRKERTRKGRGPGSGLGKTAGRGVKGQTSRAGSGVPAGFEGGQTPLQRRLPKVGFKNLFRKEFQVVNVSDLEKRCNAGETIEPATLKKLGLIRSTKGLVKVLGDGTLSKSLTVKAHKFSKSAIKKINEAGGQVEELRIPGARTE